MPRCELSLRNLLSNSLVNPLDAPTARENIALSPPAARLRLTFSLKAVGLGFRLSERRYHKLLLLSVEQDRTMSSLIEELIDSLPEPKKNLTVG